MPAEELDVPLQRDSDHAQAAAELLRVTEEFGAGFGENATELKSAYSDSLDEKLARH